MADKPELVYFAGRGLGEITRLTLAVAGIEFTQTDIQTREQFLALKPELLFHQTPLLRIDGLNLVQSRAITRYVARKANLLGSNEVESVRIDMLYEGSRDFNSPFLAIRFQQSEEETKKGIQEKALPKYLPIYEKLLGDSSSGFLVGDNRSLADLGLLEVLLNIVDYFGEESLQKYPNILTFLHKQLADEKVINYKQNIRRPKNSEAYVESIKKILQF